MGLGGLMLMRSVILPIKAFTHVMPVDFMQNSTARVKWHVEPVADILSTRSCLQHESGYRRSCLSLVAFSRLNFPRRSQWPRGLRRGSTAARLLRSWVRIPPEAWMFVVRVVCCQVEVSEASWPLVQRSHTDCGASLCMIYKGWNFNSGNYLFTTDTK